MDSLPEMLSMLLDAQDEDGEGFTATELRDQLMHLLFGGHDTSSSTVSFLFYELARNPTVLSRLLTELDQTLGGRPPTVAAAHRAAPHRAAPTRAGSWS